jgi:hypothetical protein
VANITIGDSNVESINDGATWDTLCGTRFLVPQDCTLQSISLYCASGGTYGLNAILSAYSDTDGLADALLTQSEPVALQDGWTTASVPSITLKAGSYVWLCWIVDSSLPAEADGWHYTDTSGKSFYMYNPYSNGLPVVIANIPSAAIGELCASYVTSLYSIYALAIPPAPGTATLTISIYPVGGGSTTPSGTNSYPVGTSVPVVATPAKGYNFAIWIIDDSVGSKNRSIPITMNTNHSLLANFAPQPKIDWLALAAIATAAGALIYLSKH